VKLYQKRDVNETLSSTLEIVLRQVRVPIPQSKILQREYRKRELAVLFSFWTVLILTRYCDLRYNVVTLLVTKGD